MIVTTTKQLLSAITKMADSLGLEQYRLEHNEETKTWDSVIIDAAHVVQLQLQLRLRVINNPGPMELDVKVMQDLLKRMPEGEVVFEYVERMVEVETKPNKAVGSLPKIKLRYMDQVDGGRKYQTKEYTGEVMENKKLVNLKLPVTVMFSTQRLKQALKYLPRVGDAHFILLDPERNLVFARSHSQEGETLGFGEYCLGEPKEISDETAVWGTSKEQKTVVGEEIKTLVPIDYIDGFIKAVDPKLFPDLEMKFGTDIPVKMTWIGTEGSRVAFLCAPRIESD